LALLRINRRSMVLATVGSVILIVLILSLPMARHRSRPLRTFLVLDPSTQHVILNTSKGPTSVRFYSLFYYEGSNLSGYARYGVARQWLLNGGYKGYLVGIEIFTFRGGIRPTTFTRDITDFGPGPQPCTVGSDCFTVSTPQIGSIMAFGKGQIAVRIVAQKRRDGKVVAPAELRKLGSELFRCLEQASAS